MAGVDTKISILHNLREKTWIRSLSNLNVSTIAGFILFITLCWLVGTAVYRLYFHPLSKFPGPPLFAVSFLPFLYGTYITGKYHRKILDYHRRYGHVVRLGPNHLAFDGDAAFPQVYSHRPGRTEWQKMPNWIFLIQSNTLIGADTENHRRMRRQIGPAFSDTGLKGHEQTIIKYTNSLMNRLTENVSQGKSMNISRLFNFYTFDLISDLAFSNPMGSLEKGEFHPWVKTIMESGPSTGVYHFVLLLNSVFPVYFFIRLLGLGSPVAAGNEDSGLAVQMATQRLEAGCNRLDGSLDFVGHMEEGNRGGKAFMTREEILINASTLIVAGSETTASALTGCIYYLDRNPQVKKALEEEIHSSFESLEHINLRSVAKLVYLHAVVEEILRIYPPGAEIIPRVSPGDLIDGKWVPKGTTCTIHVYSSNHNPNYFYDPESFQPQRWLPASHPLYDARFQNENQAACKSFSCGPRDCLGKNLALMEIKMALAKVVWKFDFNVLPGHEDWLDQTSFMMWEKKPLIVNLKIRT